MDGDSRSVLLAEFAAACRDLAARTAPRAGAFAIAALLGSLSPASAVAQADNGCVGSLNTCMAGCSATGALGALLGGGGAAAAQRECRVACGQQRRECEARARQAAAPEAPAVPEAPARVAPPRPASA